MRKSSISQTALLVAALGATALAGGGIYSSEPARTRRPRPPNPAQDQQREDIARHNAAVDAKRRAKLAARNARKLG